MSERYSRVYTLPKLLHEPDAPVIIMAGALLRDNKDNCILAQLKIRNICPKIIKAVTVEILSEDTAGRPLNEKISYDYLDLYVQRDQEFGSQNAIRLNESSARSFDAIVREIVFSDRTVWTSKGVMWKQLPSTRTLQDYLVEASLIRQFRIHYGEKAEVKPTMADGIWQCTCGTWNLNEEAKCHNCNTSLEQLLACDLQELREERDARLEKERIEREEFERRQREEKERREAEERAAREERERMAEKKREIRAKQKKKALISIGIVLACISCIAFAIVLVKVIIPNNKYHSAMVLYKSGKYDEAVSAFNALNGYKDSAEKMIECEEAKKEYNYNNALDLYNSGQYEKAIAVFRELDEYKDSKDQVGRCDTAILDRIYNNAITLIDEEQYNDAYEALTNLDGYKDSASKAEEVYYKYILLDILKTASVGDYISFGTYEQDNDETNGKEDIEWMVLDKEEDKLLVISRYALDCKPFHSPVRSVTWDSCSLRAWLNDSFTNNAFTAEAINRICLSNVKADTNKIYKNTPGKDTDDRVFLLSASEIDKYLRTYTDKECIPTDYAIAKGATTDSSYLLDGEVTCWWWLRTAGNGNRFATCVWSNGSVYVDGFRVDEKGVAVRPAMWISLEP